MEDIGETNEPFLFLAAPASLEPQSGSNAQRLPGCCSSPECGTMDPNFPGVSQHEPTSPRISLACCQKYLSHWSAEVWILLLWLSAIVQTILLLCIPQFWEELNLVFVCIFEWNFLNAGKESTQHSKVCICTGSSIPTQHYLQIVKQEVSSSKFRLCWILLFLPSRSS